MSKKIILTISLLAILAFSLVACERPASKSPVKVPAASGAATPVAPVNANGSAATQTAQAVISKFNMPTAVVTDTAGNKQIITQVPPAMQPIGTPPTPTGHAPIDGAAARPTEHTIAQGETVDCLARRYDVDPDEIIKLNHIDDPSALSIGDKLKIPQEGKYPHASRKANEYSRPDVYMITGETTVSEVACWYGDVTPEEIMRVNNLTSNDLPQGIDTLNLP